MSNPERSAQMLLGVDYYPEHWPRERWETDARLVREAGITRVRMGEFDWHRMEPTEDRFDFGLVLDFYRFSSDVQGRFQREQAEILRRLSPGRTITHDFMGLFHHHRLLRADRRLGRRLLGQLPVLDQRHGEDDRSATKDGKTKAKAKRKARR